MGAMVAQRWEDRRGSGGLGNGAFCILPSSLRIFSVWSGFRGLGLDSPGARLGGRSIPMVAQGYILFTFRNQKIIKLCKILQLLVNH